MAGLNELLPGMGDVFKARNWIPIGFGIGAGILLANWAQSKLQAAGLTFPAQQQAYLSNTWNTLPNSPYRSFRSSVRFSS